MKNIEPFGREFTKRPACPFCGMPIERPQELSTRRPGEMPVGSCSCGAVYAFDVTGHNLGAAFIEALVFGCDMDWDLAWNLFPEEDYLEKLVENYDLDSHLIVPGGSYEGRRISGALYFIRLHQDIRDATGRGAERKLERARAAAVPPPPPSAGPAEQKSLTKKEVEELVKEYRVDRLVGAAGQDRRIVRHLQRLLYSGDHLVRARTAEILGKVSAVIARRDPGPISNLLQELLNSVAAPGASSWGSIEAIGEIIGNSPDLFAGYIPPLYTFLGDPDHRPQILRAAARVAQTRPDLVRGAAFRLLPFLRDPDPETRGCAALLFGRLGMAEAKKDLAALRDDATETKVYKNGAVEKTSVGRLAREALERMMAGSGGQETEYRRQETEC
ncbi:MAG: DVU0298 family protein [Bacillota bacterium]